MVALARFANVREGQYRSGLGDGEYMRHLMLAVLNRHRGHDQPQPGTGHVGQILLHTVGQVQHHNIVAPQALRMQHGAETVYLVAQFIPGQAAWRAVGKVAAVAGVHHRFGVWMGRPVMYELVPQGLVAPPTGAGVLLYLFRADQHHVSSPAPSVRR